MITETLTTPAPSLSDLVKHGVRALIRRYHLNRDWIIGLVGERGSGKSLGGANIALRDFMMNGEPCWSNMNIKLQVDVDDASASLFGVQGGNVVYEAQHIDKQAFLALDGRYEGGCLFFDEFNLEYGEARRSSANVNLATDRAIQQLRKLQCGLVYTVINEMYVDSRIRENTDVFIQCQDVAFKPLNMINKMQQGYEFEWNLVPMTTKLVGAGMRYQDTGRTLGPYKMQLKHIWGSIDTMERQAEGMTSYSQQTKTLLPVQMKEDPVVVADRDKWGWLDKSITKFFDNHTNDGDIIEISSNDLRHEFGVEKESWPYVCRKLYDKLPDIETVGNSSKRYPTKFKIPNRILV